MSTDELEQERSIISMGRGSNRNSSMDASSLCSSVNNIACCGSDGQEKYFGTKVGSCSTESHTELFEIIEGVGEGCRLTICLLDERELLVGGFFGGRLTFLPTVLELLLKASVNCDLFK